MTFIPHSDAERCEMLQAVGVGCLEDLFRDVPARVRFPSLNLPQPIGSGILKW